MSKYMWFACAPLLAMSGSSALAEQQLSSDQLQIVSGENQSVPQRGDQASFGPVSARLLDKDGHPRAQQAIMFRCSVSSNLCSFASGAELEYKQTDASGLATSSGFSVSKFVGSFDLQVVGSNSGPIVNVRETVTP